MTVLAVPYLVERGCSAPFAAFAVGLIGFSQIPGRVAVRRRRPRGCRAAWATAGVFALIAVGIALLVGVHGTVAASHRARRARHGQRHGDALARDLIADRYGAGAYGTIGGVAASFTTGARAGGPVAAAVYAAAVGYTTLLWTLAALALVAAALAWNGERAATAE